MNTKKIINRLGLGVCLVGGIISALKFYNSHELYHGIWLLMFTISEFHFVDKD